MEYAIVESGGKQFKVIPGSTIEVDLLPAEVGTKVVLDQVLLLSDGKKVTIGKPTVDGVRVETTVVAQVKAPKITVFKYKPKNRYRVKSGHRQRYTRLMVESIKQAAKKKKAAKKKEEAKEEAAE